ncbi:MAG: DUF3791 domain-containing protein [Oscillospiraceae bacterium]|jgi:hypothetical protein|nr:DUF3791 domain-containing protein [Oscillospiraceae bacterium]
MGTTQTTVSWVFYMLTLLKKQFAISWEEFDKLQNRYKLSAFLLKHYELLHYYDNEYIIDDTLSYIKEQGGDISALY